MNKAFVRELDAPPPTCPQCERRGVPVTLDTRRAHLPEGFSDPFAPDASYCENSACPVVYFDGWGASVTTAEVTVHAYPKVPDGWVCCCLRVAVGEIQTEARSGARKRLLAVVAHGRSDQAACVTACPDGRSCAKRVRAVYQAARDGES